jgi:ribosomal protein S18 acetylase RimI-like enzyme
LSYRLEPLAARHELEAFSCGTAPLDDWLKHHARNASGQGTRTYVLVDTETRFIVGYCAIAPHLVERDVLPGEIGRGAPRQIAAILLAKLAVDQRLQRRGLGSELLIRALALILESSKKAEGKVVVVDAVDDEAVAFYERHDLKRLPGNSHRLVMKLSTAAKALGLPWR